MLICHYAFLCFFAYISNFGEILYFCLEYRQKTCLNSGNTTDNTFMYSYLCVLENCLYVEAKHCGGENFFFFFSQV